MARLSIDIPTSLEKIRQKTDTQRRKSTGNSSIQIKEPNYLRASKGSCHDYCKYGTKPVFPVKPWRPVGRTPDKNVNISLNASPGNDHQRGKKALTSPKLMTVSPRQQLNGLLKHKTPQTDAFRHRPTQNQLRRTMLTSSTNKRESANVAGKSVKVSKKSNSPPLSSSSSPKSSPKVPTLKSTASNSLHKKVSQPETKNKTSYENVPEKIIHVIEPEDEKRNKGHVQESNNCAAFTANQNEILNSAAEKNRKKTNKVINPDESDSSPKKLKFRRGKVLAIENGNAGSIERCLRRSPVSEEKVNHKKNESIGCVLRNQAVKLENTDSVLMNVVIEERASNLVKMRKTKVEALVGAFESVISNTQYP